MNLREKFAFRGTGYAQPIATAHLLAGRYWQALQSVNDGKFGKVRSGLIGHAENNQGAIIMGSGIRAAVIVGFSEDAIGDGASGVFPRNSREKSRQALQAKFLFLDIFRFDDAVGSKNDHVAGLQIENGVVVFRAGKQAERHAFQTNRNHVTIPDEERVRSTSF